MPSPSKSQLNLSVDSKLKAEFKALCDSKNISLAKAFECFMANSIEAQRVLGVPGYSPSLAGKSPSISPSPSSESPNESPSIARLESTIKDLEDRLLGK